MSTYHIKKDGTPGVCNAKAGNCPLGQHFKTEEEAQQYFDIKSEIETGNQYSNSNITDKLKNDLQRQAAKEAIEEKIEKLNAEIIKNKEVIKSLEEDTEQKREVHRLIEEANILDKEFEDKKEIYKEDVLTRFDEELSSLNQKESYAEYIDGANYKVEISNEFNKDTTKRKPLYTVYINHERRTMRDLPQNVIDKVFESQENKRAWQRIKSQEDLYNRGSRKTKDTISGIQYEKMKPNKELKDSVEEARKARFAKQDEWLKISRKRTQDRNNAESNIRDNEEELKKLEGNLKKFDDMEQDKKDIKEKTDKDYIRTTYSPTKEEISVDKDGKINNIYIKKNGNIYAVKEMDKYGCKYINENGEESHSNNIFYNNWNMKDRSDEEVEYNDYIIVEKEGSLLYDGEVNSYGQYIDRDTSD